MWVELAPTWDGRRVAQARMGTAVALHQVSQSAGSMAANKVQQVAVIVVGSPVVGCGVWMEIWPPSVA